MERNQRIIRTSIIGILVNVVLVLFKMAVGFFSNSIAVILDAVNNLGDALSSVITIIGTRLSGRAPDKKHPYGYGRIEYLTSVLISVIVLVAGLTALRESVGKLLHPEAASYSVLSLVILAVGVVAKFLCGRYVKSVGEQIHADALVASGSDAYFDSILSFSTLVAAIISVCWGISLEGILGVVISIIILKAGLGMLIDTLDSIIGVRTDKELAESLKAKVNSFPQVLGSYDLALHNYGPTQVIGSIHIEVEDSMTAKEIHRLSRRITEEVYTEFGILLTVGIYASNTSDEQALRMKAALREIVASRPEILQMHGFYADSEKKQAAFDLIVDFSADAEAVSQDVVGQMQAQFPEWRFYAAQDSDYSD